jgi:hypothetical protein
VKGAYESPYGRIVSNWKRENDRLMMEVTIPVNTTAEVFVPANDANSVTESGKPVSESQGLKFLRMQDGAAAHAIGSGRYRFESPFPGKIKAMKSTDRMKKLTLLFLLLLGAVCSAVAEKPQEAVSHRRLDDAFRNPPEESKPWCYWYWLDGDISKEGITKDLESMARVGIKQAMIGNIRQKADGPVKMFSPEWYRLDPSRAQGSPPPLDRPHVFQLPAGASRGDHGSSRSNRCAG